MMDVWGTLQFCSAGAQLSEAQAVRCAGMRVAWPWAMGMGHGDWRAHDALMV